MEEINFESPINEKKKSGKNRYLIYLLLVIIVTGLAIFLSLKDNFAETALALRTSDWKILVLIIGMVVFSYLIDGLIIFVFARLYTRRYKYHQGLATSMVGAFLMLSPLRPQADRSCRSTRCANKASSRQTGLRSWSWLSSYIKSS